MYTDVQLLEGYLVRFCLVHTHLTLGNMKLLPLGEEGSENHQYQYGHEHTTTHPAEEQTASGRSGYEKGAASIVWEAVEGGGKGMASLFLMVKGIDCLMCFICMFVTLG